MVDPAVGAADREQAVLAVVHVGAAGEPEVVRVGDQDAGEGPVLDPQPGQGEPVDAVPGGRAHAQPHPRGVAGTVEDGAG